MGLELVLELVVETPKTQNQENPTFKESWIFYFARKHMGFPRLKGHVIRFVLIAYNTCICISGICGWLADISHTNHSRNVRKIVK